MAEPFDEFLRSLNANGVEYVVVGGHAVMLHGYPRSTDDLDILYSQSQANAERLAAAVAAFVPEAAPEDFLGPSDEFITLTLRGHRIDLLPEIAGVVTASVLQQRVAGRLFGEPTHFIDLGSLLTSKRSTGRLKDAADVEELEAVQASGEPGAD